MTVLSGTLFSPAILTSGRAGCPAQLRSVEEARAFVERERLPVVRSGYHWLDVHQRLTRAQATRAAPDVAAARAALAAALARDGEAGSRAA